MVDPQFQMFDETPREEVVREISVGGASWSVVVEARECADRLFRGRFLFRTEERELRTADLFVESDHEGVLERARGFEEHLLRDLIRSLT
jgi:hypothetical protein